MSNFDISEISRRMDGAVKSLHADLNGLRTGRASTAILDGVTVDVYGARMPLNQVGSVGVPEPRLLTVQVWDKENIKAVEKAITNAGLGLNPMSDGDLVRVPVPELSAERRKELAKIANKYSEQSRVAVRNVRRDGMEQLKKLKSSSEISEDEQKKLSDEVQKQTDDHIKKIDELFKEKEQDITQV